MLYQHYLAQAAFVHIVRPASGDAAVPGTRPAPAKSGPATRPRQPRRAPDRFPVIRAAAEVVNDLVTRLRQSDGSSGHGCLVLRVPNRAQCPPVRGRGPNAPDSRGINRLPPHRQAAHGRACPAHPRNLKGLLPLLRAVGITNAVATLSGDGNRRRVDRVDIYPSSAVFIKVPAHAPDGARPRGAVTQVPATEAVQGVVEGMIDGIRWRNGHRGRLWIDVLSGDTRLEMHGDRD